MNLVNIIEALLMAADRPLSLDELAKLLCIADKSAIQEALRVLGANYQHRGIELKEVASGYRLQTAAEFSCWVAKLREGKTLRYSRALLETLALIAYRQPITRAEIEDVRGVAVSSNIMRTLTDHEWIKIIGYKEVPGKPAMYGTTKKFLDYFNLTSIAELPEIKEDAQ